MENETPPENPAPIVEIIEVPPDTATIEAAAEQAEVIAEKAIEIGEQIADAQRADNGANAAGLAELSAKVDTLIGAISDVRADVANLRADLVDGEVDDTPEVENVVVVPPAAPAAPLVAETPPAVASTETPEPEKRSEKRNKKWL